MARPIRVRPMSTGRATHHRASAEGPEVMLSSQHRFRSVFFHHSHAQPSILAWAQDCHTQSWRGHRIAPLNPGAGTGLPHSILAWAQDCHTQSWRGHRIAPVFPRERWKRSAVQHYAPRLAARIARKKHRQCVGTQRCTPGLAARLPGFEFWDSRRSGTRRARARTSAPPRRAARCSPRPGRRRERGG